MAALLGTALGLGFGWELRAASRFATWIGSENGDWENSANWLGGEVPNNTATATYSVRWRDHPVTVRVNGNVVVDDLVLSSGGVLALAHPDVHFEVRNRLEWTHGTLDGSGPGGLAGPSARLTTHGHSLLGRAEGELLQLRGRCGLVIRDYARLESVLRCGADSEVTIEAPGLLHAGPGAGFSVASGQPGIRNAGRISIDAGARPFLTLPISNTGTIVVGARTIEFAGSFGAEDGIQMRGGSLRLQESSVRGHVQLDEGEILGSGFVGSAEIHDPISGRLRFGELAVGQPTSCTFVIGRPHDRLEVAGQLVLEGLQPRLRLARHFIPGPDERFEIVLASGGIEGQFEDADLSPIEFGTRLDVIGFVGAGPATGVVGSFLVDQTPDSRVIVLHGFLPPSVKLAETPLLYRFSRPEAGDPGGCFLAPHAAIRLPDAEWAGGGVEVAITRGYQAGIDAFSFRYNGRFPDGAILRFADLPEGGSTVSFRGTAFGTARIQGEKMTCALGVTASAEAIVALLGQLHYGNREFTPEWFRRAEDRYPARVIRITLTDGSGQRSEVVREVAFPHLIGLGLGGDRTLLQGAFDPTITTGEAVGAAVLVAQGRFSGLPFEETLPVPNLSTVWDSSCAMALSPLPDNAPGRRRIVMYAPYGDSTCCSVDARAGGFLARAYYVFSPNLGNLNDCLILRAAGSTLCDADAAHGARAALHQAVGRPAPVAPAAFHALRALMTRSEEGRRLVDLYRRHTAEVVRILFGDPILRDQAITVLTRFQPGVTALLAGRGAEFRIDPALTGMVNDLWTELGDRAGPELKAALAGEQERLDRFRVFANRDFGGWADVLSIPTPDRPFVHISSVSRTAAGLTIEINDGPGASPVLWKASNLRDWVPVAGMESVRDGSTLRLTDPAALARDLYYKVRLDFPTGGADASD